MTRLLFGLLALIFCQPTLAQEPAPSTDCTKLMMAVAQISAALDQAQLDEASTLATQARKDLACQEKPVSNLVLTSLFHLSGAVHMFLGEEKAAWESFGFSASIAPMATLNPVLGAQAQETHEILRQSVLAAPQGQIQFSGEAKVWLDGKEVAVGPTMDMPAGQHFLQWQGPGQPMQNRVIRVESGEARAIPVGAGAESFQGDSFGGVNLEAKHWAMIGGGAAVVTGGVLLALGLKTKGEFANTSDPNELDALAQKANSLFKAGGATAGLGIGTMIAGPIFLEGGSPGFQVGFVW